ncbi:hypothetical protein GCM10011297_02350 [Bacterioplanes sanyensis]|uniref:hypothetical protein n=1 Tax=Bacterioplanes sanyensis TaxID=1249553 RepID=UPI0016748D51|nr:hypothetical protein [Bacterioplanes sanyensis]GGY32943.1 hypothetical protein GCM10011297_02350 [Bacterioplanes sanyensis]
MKHLLPPKARKDLLLHWFSIRQHDADRSEELQLRQQLHQPQPRQEQEHWLNTFLHSWRS